jgi:glycine cleavage system H protein
MTINKDYLYTKDHEWVSAVQGGTATVGISDFAQSELGEVVFIDLPKIGKKINKGDVLCVVESTKAASDVYAPLSGEVVAVNDSLAKEPVRINNAPYTEGWIAKLKVSNQGETKELMDSAAYEAILKGN